MLFLLINALGILYTNVYNMEVLGNFDTYWHIPDIVQISLWILENTKNNPAPVLISKFFNSFCQ